jgi:hypothetical protein
VALAAIEALEKRRGRPTRHDARPVLLELGRLLGEGDGMRAEEAKRRIAGLPPGSRRAGRWPSGTRSRMAATEYTLSLDPRYLDHPKYDWEYTLEARRRLAWRLEAVRFLGIRPRPSRWPRSSAPTACSRTEAGSSRRGLTRVRDTAFLRRRIRGPGSPPRARWATDRGLGRFQEFHNVWGILPQAG